MTKQEQIDWFLERMNDAIDKWHNSPTNEYEELPAYLGLSREGWCLFVQYPRMFAARLLGLDT